MGDFSAGDILFILIVGGVVCGLLVLVGAIRKKPDPADRKSESLDDGEGT